MPMVYYNGLLAGVNDLEVSVASSESWEEIG